MNICKAAKQASLLSLTQTAALETLSERRHMLLVKEACVLEQLGYSSYVKVM
jgi:hypothetical protein